jgi:transaldolase
MPRDGGDCEQVLAEFAAAGVDLDALAERLQSESVQFLLRSWEELLGFIAAKSAEREAPAATLH